MITKVSVLLPSGGFSYSVVGVYQLLYPPIMILIPLMDFKLQYKLLVSICSSSTPAVTTGIN